MKDQLSNPLGLNPIPDFKTNLNEASFQPMPKFAFNIIFEQDKLAVPCLFLLDQL